MNKYTLTPVGATAPQTFHLNPSEIVGIIPNENGTSIYLRGVPEPIKVTESVEQTSSEISLSTNTKRLLNSFKNK